MLVGCCHCGQPEESVPSFVPPSVNTPSLLNPSESVPSAIGGGPGFCGACYNFPGRWKVATKGDWFVWNPNWWPRQVDDCPIVPTYVTRTLYYTAPGGLYGGLTRGADATVNYGTPCAIWRSTEKAIELSSNPCSDSPPLYMPCGPNTYNIPLLELAAWESGSQTTIFALFYWWSVCGSPTNWQLGYWWQWVVHREVPPYSISCVRNFSATMQGSAGDDLLGLPYSLSTVDTSWGTVVVEPA